ncbi:MULTISPECIES: phosphate signaling complex protein PhoU [Hyphomicrobiales]|uniref:Phosphate-specific transport system accessory protein PhoU n=2 Tax=Hyphomicrobiales TaxID=356 RepID=A0A1G5M4N2_AFIMA|nr:MULTISPECIES: phosphate signaling complex protein PhoU [Hyphomicrobiales]MBK1625972.1 phosphate transport system regulatory protein PhoU [Afifella marina]MBK1622978.1 phosphate transport system regulatory protein PhoU [Afifella marina DSM 2698]MBK5917796.1 phosphate transport system regulatory protein PhoU [Afifella marina]MDQ0325037.1 phosphate transport system protein [Rhodopseudomonas julia]RAI23700.1 phosphate transport system regulatory protein PhoU [Afifella marina DSM 2698]
MSEHIVTSYDEELRELARSIAEMGGLVEQQLDDAVNALLSTNSQLAQDVILGDRQINQMHYQIEERAILVIAKRQPMAQDLRETVAAIRISHDLERVGDLGKNIAKRALAIEDQRMNHQLRRGVEHLASLGLRQLKDVLDAYGSRDVQKAISVWRSDDEIDAMYVSLFREMLTYMMEDPRNIGMCTHLLFCAKNIERIGDHATNIAETITYLVTGKQMERAATAPSAG